MSNGYGINGIGAYDYMSLMNDSAFMATLQSYNINSPSFKGMQPSMAQGQAPDYATMLGGTNLPTNTNISFKAADDAKSGSGVFWKGALMTAAAVGSCIYASKRGNGKGIIEGFKNIFNGIKGKPTRAMKDFTLNAKDGSRIVVEKGKIISIQTKADDTVIKNVGKINNELSRRGVSVPNYINGKKLNDNVALTRYAIAHGGGTERYKFFIENGEIVEIRRLGKGKKVSDVEKFMETYTDKAALQDRIKSIDGGTYKDYSKLSDVSYTWTDPNTGITLFKAADGKQQLTIPGKLNKALSEAEQKAWLNKNSEVDKQVQELISKGRSEGIKVDSNIFVDSKGNTYEINSEGKIISIQLKAKKGNPPQVLDKDTTEFNAWLYDHKDVQESIKKEFESGLGFDGATFMAA